MVDAARIARFHRMDPVVLLQDPDDFHRAVRVAAVHIANRDYEAARERAKNERGR